MNTVDADNHADKTNLLDANFIQSVQKKMLAFANSQLKDHDRAQDAVQEALTAALNHQSEFQGQAMFKTWVFAILKNKIADEIRKNSRYVPLSQMRGNHTDEDNTDEEFMQSLFNDSGHWHKDSQPQAFDNSWNNPESQAQGEGFWQILEICLAALPADQSRAFLMREYIELETDIICNEMEISTKNFYVLMHRARLRLQQCLNVRWFA